MSEKYILYSFIQNVKPDPRQSCGLYTSITSENMHRNATVNESIDANSHDTIGIIAIDTQGNIAAGASTNGLPYKIPG